jgi:hypothetical protein
MGQSYNSGLIDTNMIQKKSISPGLLFEGGTFMECGSKVSETGRYNPVEVIPKDRTDNDLALVVSAPAPMDDQNVRAISTLDVLNIPVRRSEDPALTLDPSVGPIHIDTEEPSQKGHGKKQGP